MEEAEDQATRASYAMGPGSDTGVDNARGDRRVVLRTIVIDNFKNYIGEHTLNVDGESFVCFFGRNGAGKSCVVDAIAFCLGASPQQLRVKRFANLVNDVVATNTPGSVASVVLHFDIVDGADKHKCIWVKRAVEAATSQTRYFCRESGSSNWKGTSKSLLAPNLRRFGVDMDLQDRFIIRQANATGLAQMTSVQLLHFCEQIIGTCDLKEQLAHINIALSERSRVAEEIRQRIQTTENEANQCQPMVSKFQDWVDMTQKIKASLLEAKESLISVDQRLLRCHRIQQIRVNTEIKQQRSKDRDLRRSVERKERERARLVEVLEEQHNIVSEAVLQLKKVTRAKVKCSSALQTASAELVTVHTRLAHFRREQADGEALVSELSVQALADASLLVKKEVLLKDLEEMMIAKQAESVQTKSQDQEIEELVHELGTLEAEQREAISKQESRMREMKEAQRTVARIEKDLETCLQKKCGQEAVVTKLEKALNIDMQATANQTEAQESLRSQLERLEADIELQTRSMAKIVSRSRGDEAIYQLQASLGRDAVFGRLWELAFTEPMYATAVNSALRSQLSFVVVRDRQAAVSIARIFADEAIGRVSCCVLEDFDCQTRCDTCTRETSSEGHDDESYPIPLCQILKCRSETARLVLHKFGHNWMICRDADQATELSSGGASNFVTLQGDLFLLDGSIRACRSEDVSKMRNGPRIRISGTQSKSCTSTDVSEFDASVANLSAQLNKCRADHEEAQRKTKELEKHIHSSRLKISVARHQLKEDCIAVDTLEDELEQARQKLQRCDALPSSAYLEEANVRKAKIAKLRKRKARLAKSGKDKERAELLTKQAQVKNDITSMKERDALNKTRLSKLQGKQRAIDLQLLTLQEKAEDLSREEEKLRNHLKTVQEDVATRIKQLDEAKEATAISRSKLEEYEAEMRLLSRERREVRLAIERLIKNEDDIAAQLASLENEVDNIGLPVSERDAPMEPDHLNNLEELRTKARQDVQKRDEEQRVQDIVKSSISVETVERAIACEQELIALQAQLDSTVADMRSLSSRQHEIAMTRYQQVVNSLQVVNDNLSRIYRLMNEDGDCYLGYSLERTTLFAEGITLNCKPDESHWQPFVGLSGGQQVLCAVSLMLALQASFPSPFYVCDEIDAALDTVNVRKLAELLRDQSCQSNTQFLVVSHRPEMWEIAKYLIGVYEHERSAQIVWCRFE